MSGTQESTFMDIFTEIFTGAAQSEGTASIPFILAERYEGLAERAIKAAEQAYPEGTFCHHKLEQIEAGEHASPVTTQFLCPKLNDVQNFMATAAKYEKIAANAEQELRNSLRQSFS